MTQADSVHSTPPTNTPRLPDGLIQQERQRQRALKRIAKLRKKAADEIERLISFLDVSDPYASTELEESEGDLEEGGDEEPSLGSSDRNFDQDGTWAHWTGHRWDTDPEEDNSDNEPSLGWTEDESARGRYVGSTPATVDLEEQPDDEGVRV